MTISSPLSLQLVASLCISSCLHLLDVTQSTNDWAKIFIFFIFLQERRENPSYYYHTLQSLSFASVGWEGVLLILSLVNADNFRALNGQRDGAGNKEFPTICVSDQNDSIGEEYDFGGNKKTTAHSNIQGKNSVQEKLWTKGHQLIKEKGETKRKIVCHTGCPSFSLPSALPSLQSNQCHFLMLFISRFNS